MVNYELLEQTLNAELKKILNLIKEDYYSSMSEKKKQVLDSLLKSDNIKVNNGISKLGEKNFAHGGRALKDGKIHFYPDSRKFASSKELEEKCKRLLPHEIFHYFIQPDDLKLNTNLEREMASFYTEGLVEKEARKFCERHKDIAFEKANYGYNINFVNTIQTLLKANSYDVIFSENDYLRNIGKYADEYKECLEKKKKDMNEISKIFKTFPEKLQKQFFNKVQRMVLQNGNIDEAREKLSYISSIVPDDLDGQDIDK